MSLFDIWIQFYEKHSVMSIGVALIIILQLIEISPIKISPWASIKKWISSWFTYDLQQQLKQTNIEIKKIDQKLDSHIKETIVTETRTRRSLILRCAAAISNGEEYNEEHLAFLVSECDAYKQYCHIHGIENGVADVNMNIIYKAYKHIKEQPKEE